MHLIVNMVIAALMFAISQVSLLAIFFSPSKEVSVRRRITVYGAAVLLCTLARCLETWKGLARYASWMVILAALCAAALLWRHAHGNLARGVIQRVLCFFLILRSSALYPCANPTNPGLSSAASGQQLHRPVQNEGRTFSHTEKGCRKPRVRAVEHPVCCGEIPWGDGLPDGGSRVLLIPDFPAR